MQFYFYKKKEIKKFSDYFKFRKSIMIEFNKTLMGKGFKTKILCDPELSKDADKIVRLISEAAEELDSSSPFALSSNVQNELEDYEIIVSGIETEYPQLFRKRCEDVGIKIENEGYSLLNQEKENKISETSYPIIPFDFERLENQLEIFRETQRKRIIPKVQVKTNIYGENINTKIPFYIWPEKSEEEN
jgi:hypothetical protein